MSVWDHAQNRLSGTFSHIRTQQIVIPFPGAHHIALLFRYYCFFIYKFFLFHYWWEESFRGGTDSGLNDLLRINNSIGGL